MGTKCKINIQLNQKEYGISNKTGRVYGHDGTNPHGKYHHINIKRTDGKNVLINIIGKKR